MGHQGMTTSQERSMGRHLVSHVLRGQIRGSTGDLVERIEIPLEEKAITRKCYLIVR